MSEPRKAATVLVLRCRETASHDIVSHVEVLLVRRGARASFMANAYVFPGGRVDPQDAVPDPTKATRRAAARELAEEASLSVASLDDLDLFARWVTPSAEPKRFDTDFFLYWLPSGQTPTVDEHEVFDLRWMTPDEALHAYQYEGLNLPPPTVSTLEELMAELRALPPPRDAAALREALRGRCLLRQPQAAQPRLVAVGEGLLILMPWDADFPQAPGEGEPMAGLALHAVPVPQRIARCRLVPPGTWQVERMRA